MIQGLARCLLPVTVGAGCMITLLSAMDALSAWQNRGLTVGAMIAFDAKSHAPRQAMPHLIVDTVDGGHCAIDLAVVQHAGGSLLIEGRAPNAAHRFVVHWVGRRTAADDRDCGPERTLIVDRQQLDAVGLAAATNQAGVPTDRADEDAFDRQPADPQHPA